MQRAFGSRVLYIDGFAGPGLDVVHVFDEHASAVMHRPKWEKLKAVAHRGHRRDARVAPLEEAIAAANVRVR